MKPPAPAFTVLPGLDHKTLVERTHRHHTVIHGHFVSELVGDIRRAADQPSASSPCFWMVGSRPDFGATRRGAASRLA